MHSKLPPEDEYFIYSKHVEDIIAINLKRKYISLVLITQKLKIYILIWNQNSRKVILTIFNITYSEVLLNVACWTIPFSNPGRDRRLFFFPPLPGLLWGPPSLLLNGYRGYFPRLKWRGA